MARMTQNLLGGPPPTELPDNTEARTALENGVDPFEVAARHPDYPGAWAELADRAFNNGSVIDSYAFARTGYHRGLDSLRRVPGRVTGPSRGSTRPTAGSCAPCTRSAAPPRPSARRPRPSAARRSCATAAPPPPTPSTAPSQARDQAGDLRSGFMPRR